MEKIVKDDRVNMEELSKQNGLTEFENFKAIIQILMVKAEVYDIPQKVVLSFPKAIEKPLTTS